MKRKRAGGDPFRYEPVMAPITSACTLGGELPNLALAVWIGAFSLLRSGWMAVHTVRPSPQRIAITLLASPAK